MKKLMLLIGAALCVSIANASDKIITIEQLPIKAQGFIKNYFANSTARLVKEDTDFVDKSYEVIFTDGSNVEFNKKGDWKDIECKAGVPTALIPTAILSKAKELFPNITIVKIDKDRDGYDIKLANRAELEFNSKIQLIDVDLD